MKKKIRLTKKFAWEECLAMYKWVAARWLLTGTPVPKLKKRWLKAHGYKKNMVAIDCFFCAYDDRHTDGDCMACPAVLIDDDFKCSEEAYCWIKKPVEFYLEIVRLNKIRLTNSKKRK